MANTRITTKLAPAAVGAYSQAVKVNDTVYVSGQIGLTPNGELLVGFEAQARQVLENLEKIVSTCDLDRGDFVKLTVFLVDLSEFSKLNEIMADFFGGSFPARSAVGVTRLPKDALVEIDAIAVAQS
jgi:reactive intermediate/imine deaminase